MKKMDLVKFRETTNINSEARGEIKESEISISPSLRLGFGSIVNHKEIFNGVATNSILISFENIAEFQLRLKRSDLDHVHQNIQQVAELTGKRDEELREICEKVLNNGFEENTRGTMLNGAIGELAFIVTLLRSDFVQRLSKKIDEVLFEVERLRALGVAVNNNLILQIVNRHGGTSFAGLTMAEFLQRKMLGERIRGFNVIPTITIPKFERGIAMEKLGIKLADKVSKNFREILTRIKYLQKEFNNNGHRLWLFLLENPENEEMSISRIRDLLYLQQVIFNLPDIENIYFSELDTSTIVVSVEEVEIFSLLEELKKYLKERLFQKELNLWFRDYDEMIEDSSRTSVISNITEFIEFCNKKPVLFEKDEEEKILKLEAKIEDILENIYLRREKHIKELEKRKIEVLENIKKIFHNIWKGGFLTSAINVLDHTTKYLKSLSDEDNLKSKNPELLLKEKEIIDLYNKAIKKILRPTKEKMLREVVKKLRELENLIIEIEKEKSIESFITEIQNLLFRIRNDISNFREKTEQELNKDIQNIQNQYINSNKLERVCVNFTTNLGDFLDDSLNFEELKKRFFEKVDGKVEEMAKEMIFVDLNRMGREMDFWGKYLKIVFAPEFLQLSGFANYIVRTSEKRLVVFRLVGGVEIDELINNLK